MSDSLKGLAEAQNCDCGSVSTGLYGASLAGTDKTSIDKGFSHGTFDENLRDADDPRQYNSNRYDPRGFAGPTTPHDRM